MKSDRLALEGVKLAEKVRGFYTFLKSVNPSGSPSFKKGMKGVLKKNFKKVVDSRSEFL
ncbi:protein of unknown function [Maridesulfovibrio hydrothermalis AM13 = DSM 14728]|uniref:Uncharacterized protein n=1 Tax=Maridesulfovibrio hydrothermalis AM13 = DSM 14728 TaxID=1121451 RepID=L0R8U4_9BACT|nr:protein of unknown function [Maridesulfovibrio hydrothermalis AM13 = DSM 14728]